MSTNKSYLRIFAIVVGILVALFLVFYVFSQQILLYSSNKFIQYLTVKANHQNIQLNHLRYGKVGFGSINSIIWKNIKVEAGVAEKIGFSRDQELAVHANSISLIIDNIFDRHFLVKVNGVDILSNPTDKEALSDSAVGSSQLTMDEAILHVRFTSFNPKVILKEVKSLTSSFERFLKDGRTTLPIEFKGSLKFVYKDKIGKGIMYVQKEGNESFLVMDRESIKMLCKMVGETVWEEEIDVVYKHPLRVPKLIKIREYARKTAHSIALQHKEMPEGPYRHVLWSYLLTQAYGKEFAEQLTTAHEAQSDPEDFTLVSESEEYHQMDLNNNAVGRRYALSKFTEESLFDRILNDKEVVFAPGLPQGQKKNIQ